MGIDQMTRQLVQGALQNAQSVTPEERDLDLAFRWIRQEEDLLEAFKKSNGSEFGPRLEMVKAVRRCLDKLAKRQDLIEGIKRLAKELE